MDIFKFTRELMEHMRLYPRLDTAEPERYRLLPGRRRELHGYLRERLYDLFLG